MKILPTPSLTNQDIDRFWSYVDKSDHCWEWSGAQWKHGYGQFLIRVDGKRQRFRAHRISYLIHFGELPALLICHKCDNPKCVRPDHLFPGTNADNMADKTRKGRAATWEKMCHRKPATGERNGKHTHPESTIRGKDHVRAVLTDEDVLTIRREYRLWRNGTRSNVTQLAEQFGVSVGHIRRIVLGIAWAHIPIDQDEAA